MFLELIGAARDLKRLRDIAGILIRYGFADVVQRMELGSALESIGDTLNWTETDSLAQLPAHVRARRALEELGPTFIKLGQVLSTRVDLFSSEWIEEFERLQSEAPAVEFEILREQVEADLGGLPAEVFQSFDETPLAAASIAQVHAATLHDGTSVIVKVRKPGIRDVVEADLHLMQRLAEAATEHLSEARRYRLPDLVDQFRRSILAELDLASEARNAERMAANLARRFGGNASVRVPKMYADWSGERLNVQERIDGIPGREVSALAPAGFDLPLLAREGARVVLSTILEDGFFHADPHPGNLFFLPGNKIVFIDFGMVGYLSERRREQLVGLLHAIVEQDEEGVADVLLELSTSDSIKRDKLVESVSMFLRRNYGIELEHLDLSAVLGDLLGLLRDHELALAPELAQTLKVFVTLEGLGRRLHPDFNLVEESAPVVRRAFAAMYSPQALTRRGKRSVMEGMRLLTQMPRELRETLRALSEASLKVRIELTELEQVADRFDRAASRVTVGLITAALIIGTAIVMTVDGGPQLFGLPMLGALGFLSAGLAGTWVLVSILRGK